MHALNSPAHISLLLTVVHVRSPLWAEPCKGIHITYVTGFWKIDHTVMREINRIFMSMLM